MTKITKKLKNYNKLIKKDKILKSKKNTVNKNKKTNKKPKTIRKNKINKILKKQTGGNNDKFLRQLLENPNICQALIIDIDTILKSNTENELELIKDFNSTNPPRDLRMPLQKYFYDYNYLKNLLMTMAGYVAQDTDTDVDSFREKLYVYFASNKYTHEEIIKAFCNLDAYNGTSLVEDILKPLLITYYIPDFPTLTDKINYLSENFRNYFITKQPELTSDFIIDELSKYEYFEKKNKVYVLTSNMSIDDFIKTDVNGKKFDVEFIFFSQIPPPVAPKPTGRTPPPVAPKPKGPPPPPPGRTPPPPPPTPPTERSSEPPPSSNSGSSNSAQEKANREYHVFIDTFKEDMAELTPASLSRFPFAGSSRSPFQKDFDKIKGNLLIDAYDIFLFDFDKTITNGCIDTNIFPLHIISHDGTKEGQTTFNFGPLTIDYLRELMPKNYKEPKTNFEAFLPNMKKFVEQLFGLKNGYFFAKFVRYLTEQNKKIAIVTLGDPGVIFMCLEILFLYLTKTSKKKHTYSNPFYNPYEELSKESIEPLMSYSSGVILSLNPSTDDEYTHFKKNKMILRLVLVLSGILRVSENYMTIPNSVEINTWLRRTLYFDGDDTNIEALKQEKYLQGMSNANFLKYISGIKTGKIQINQEGAVNIRMLNNTISNWKWKDSTTKFECEYGYGVSIKTIIELQNRLRTLPYPQSLLDLQVEKSKRKVVNDNQHFFESVINKSPTLKPGVLFTKLSDH